MRKPSFYKLIVLDEPTKEFLVSLRSLRKDRGLSIRKLAATLGMNETTMGKYETGRIIPSLLPLMSLVEYFGYDLSGSINYRRYQRLQSLPPRSQAPARKFRINKQIALDAPTKAFLASLRSLRKPTGLTCREVAEAIGICSASLGDYERGEAKPKLPTLMKLADYYGYDLSDSVNYRYFHLDSFHDLRKYRKRYEVSRRELSELTGYSSTSITVSLFGDSRCSLLCLSSIRDVLNDEHSRSQQRGR